MKKRIKVVNARKMTKFFLFRILKFRRYEINFLCNYKWLNYVKKIIASGIKKQISDRKYIKILKNVKASIQMILL